MSHSISFENDEIVIDHLYLKQLIITHIDIEVPNVKDFDLPEPELEVIGIDTKGREIPITIMRSERMIVERRERRPARTRGGES